MIKKLLEKEGLVAGILMALSAYTAIFLALKGTVAWHSIMIICVVGIFNYVAFFRHSVLYKVVIGAVLLLCSFNSFFALTPSLFVLSYTLNLAGASLQIEVQIVAMLLLLLYIFQNREMVLHEIRLLLK